MLIKVQHITRYSVETRDQIFVKVYGFLSFAKEVDKSIAKNISKSFSVKYGQKLFDHTKQSVTEIHETAETTGDLIGNKTANVVAKLCDGKITKISRTSQQNNSKSVTNQHDKEMQISGKKLD